MLKPLLVAFLGTSLLSSWCLAWNGDEHISIGSRAYHQACIAAVAAHSEASGDLQERLSTACSQITGFKQTFAYESLMGEWTALAADHTETPEQLTSIRLSDMVVDYGLFTKLATTNYRHFQPSSGISWRLEHVKALELAKAASKTSGLAAMEAFEQALAREAFAQHYLQDSFASGHMGFNRVASSNAAALTLHDKMNKLGRCVADEAGHAWYTYGDDHLKQSSTAEARVVAASASSYADLLEAFITGQISDVKGEETWRLLPAYLRQSVVDERQCVLTGAWQPLRQIGKPAESVLTFEVASVFESAIAQPSTRAITVGFSKDFIYTIPIGYRRIENRFFMSIGMPVKGKFGSYLLESGYVWHIGTSAHGTLTHEIGVGQTYLKASGVYKECRCKSATNLLYALNVEAGRVYIRFLGGPSGNRFNHGVHASAAVGYVRASAN